MLVNELLSNSLNWCQNAFARNQQGERCAINSKFATQWDVLGAIMKCYNQRQDQVEIRFRLAYHLRRQELIPATMTIGGLKSCSDAIHYWNDHHTTTHIEIAEVVATLGI